MDCIGLLFCHIFAFLGLYTPVLSKYLLDPCEPVKSHSRLVV
jgi:hypothetical protein